jgi:S1-C subfamily serine protease
MLGSPLFDMNGAVIGIETSSLSKNAEGADFYPVEKLRGDIPKFR